jgi:hypothetical protein
MPEVLAKRRAPRRIDWFDVGAGILFLTIGVLLLSHGLWHGIVHHNAMLRSVIGGVLFCTVGTLLGTEGLRPIPPHQHKQRARVSKRHRTVNL